MNLPPGQHTITQVVALYEAHGFNEFVIADQLDESPLTVRNILLGHSAVYVERLKASRPDEPNPSSAADEVEYQRLKAQYKALADNADTPAVVKEKALQWLMNEAKGRNDLAKEALEIKRKAAGASTDEEKVKAFNALVAKGNIVVLHNPTAQTPNVSNG